MFPIPTMFPAPVQQVLMIFVSLETFHRKLEKRSVCTPSIGRNTSSPAVRKRTYFSTFLVDSLVTCSWKTASRKAKCFIKRNAPSWRVNMELMLEAYTWSVISKLSVFFVMEQDNITDISTGLPKMVDILKDRAPKYSKDFGADALNIDYLF